MGYCNVNGKTYKVSQQACNARGGTYSDVPAHPLEDVPGQQGVSGSTGNRAIANMLGINNSTSYLDAIESGLSKLGRGVGDVLSGNVELPGTKAERIKASRQSNVPDNLNPNSPNFGKFTIPPAGPQTGPTNEAGLFQQSDVATGKQAPAQPAGSMSIWDEMKTKDYWQKSMSGMPGDTRLSRIGQLMSYYGTPQAQRGVDPAGGFASRDYEAAQLQQQQNKAFTDAQALAAGMQITANKDTIEFYRKSIPSEGLLERQYLKSKRWFGLDETARKALAAKTAKTTIEVMNLLALRGIQPTEKNVIAYLTAKEKQG